MKNQFLIFALSALCLTSCINAKVTPLSNHDLITMKGKAVAIVRTEKPSFSAATPGSMMMISSLTGGIAGYIGRYINMTYKGNKIVRDNEIEDPAFLTSSNLAKYLRTNFDAKVIDEKIITKISDLGELADQYKDSADYILNVKTVNWAIIYLRFNTNHYRVIYSSRLELIDVRTKKIIAESPCYKNPSAREVENPPTYDALLYEKAKILKEELVVGANACSDLFERVVFLKK